MGTRGVGEEEEEVKAPLGDEQHSEELSSPPCLLCCKRIKMVRNGGRGKRRVGRGLQNGEG
jgi:hypothetical protein